LSEINRGRQAQNRGGKGHSFLSPSKRKVKKKITGKEGQSKEIKP